MSLDSACPVIFGVRTLSSCAEIERFVQPAILDLAEVDLVDIDGIRLRNECQKQGVQVVNCSLYIRRWTLQEKGVVETRASDPTVCGPVNREASHRQQVSSSDDWSPSRSPSWQRTARRGLANLEFASGNA